MMPHNPLPLTFAVPEKMILCFLSEFVEDLPLLEHTEAWKRFEKDLNWEIVAMLLGSLAADHYWNERITLFPETALSFLRRTILKGITNVGGIDGRKVGTYPLQM